MSERRQSQSDQILAALKSGRKLTPIDALNDFDCMRLGARIEELRKQGFDIKTEDFQTRSGKHVALYSLSDERQLRLIA